MGNSGVTRRLAEFLVRAKYEDLPSEVVHAAKMMILDTLGIGIAASVVNREDVAPVVRVTEEWGGRKDCTLIGSGEKTSWFNAILVNGTFMHSLDYDDTRPGLVTHTGVVVVPAVLALGEKLKISGKEAILATVLGHETVFRVASSVMPTHYQFWHSTGTNGTFAAAAVAGKLNGLNADEMERALGIAADQASGLISSVEGDLTKWLHAGLTSAKGALSAMLVKNGATAPRAILEYPRGYCNAYSRAPDLDKIVSDLGKSFDILNNAPKYYPSILCSHCAIAATLKIVTENNISADEVVKIEEKTYNVPVPKTAFENRKLETTLQARLNHPYCIAVAILDREVGMKQFEPQRLQDKRIQDLMGKVSWEIDLQLEKLYQENSFDMRPVRVTITTKGGRVFSAEEVFAKGFRKNPISPQEMERKFETLCSYALEPARIKKLKDMIKQMDSLKSISGLMRLTVEKRRSMPPNAGKDGMSKTII